MKRLSCYWIAAFALLLVSSLSQGSALPEFTEIIEDNSPAVVKITTAATLRGRRQIEQMLPPDMEIPELFREFFEPYADRLPDRRIQGMGSGFIIDKEGYVLTNFHVVEGADEINVRLIDRREYRAEVIGRDQRSDLALLKIEAEDLPVISWAEPNDLKVGEWVVAIGSPFGLDYSASAGIVSAIGRSIPTRRNENYVPFIQTDVAINPGNSGGPLFNLDGEVVGINSQIYTRSGGSIGLSFAIPAGLALEVVEQLKDKGRVERGWLGVVIQEVDSDLAKSFGMDRPYGAAVAQVEPGSPADEAGIQPGDVIIEFADRTIESSGDLPHVVGRLVPGTEVTATVMREGDTRSLDVTVGKLPDGAMEQAAAGDSGDRLGLTVAPLPAKLKQEWRLSGGVLIKDVARDSPAARTGLRPGDVLVQIGYQAIDNLEHYQAVTSKLPTGQLVPVRFFRGGRPVFRTIELPES